MVEKFVMRLNFRTKKGMIHRTSCGYTKNRDRLTGSSLPVLKDGVGWFGSSWDTYKEAKAKAELLSEFKIWDCCARARSYLARSLNNLPSCLNTVVLVA